MNSLCGRIDRFEIEHRSYGTAIYLDAHPLAVEHLRLLLKAQRVSFDRTGREWTDVLVVDGPLPPWTLETVELMSEVVIMDPPRPMSLALALDWHTSAPESEDDAFHLTPTGQLVYWSKKRREDVLPPQAEKMQRQIAAHMGTVIRRHVVYRQATALVTVPPSILKNHGYAVQLAEFLSDETGLPLVRTVGKTPVRPPRKEGNVLDLEHEFTVDPVRVDGQSVIVVDDVYKQGETIRAVALACRRAGARIVLGLTATRTISNN